MRRVFVPLLLCSPRRGRGRRGCKRGLNSFRVNSPSRIQWERRQYRAEGTIHIEFKADFPGSQRIIRLRDRDALPEGENGQDEYSMLNSAAESRRKKSDGAAAAAAAGGGKEGKGDGESRDPFPREIYHLFRNFFVAERKNSALV